MDAVNDVMTIPVHYDRWQCAVNFGELHCVTWLFAVQSRRISKTERLDVDDLWLMFAPKEAWCVLR
jgi:hypothetical protein